MHTIRIFLSKYTQWIWSVLAPLGAWGVFAIAFIDSALLGMPLDPMVAGYVYHRPHLFWLYAIMASAGSAAGSMILYVIGYKGGEVLLEKRMSKERFQRIRASFDRHEFLALMVPAILPPPAPFKLVVLSAAAFEMDWHRFLLAIFLGRLARFSLLSLLVIKFGPQVVDSARNVLRQHPMGALLALAGVIAAGVIIWKMRGRKTTAEAIE